MSHRYLFGLLSGWDLAGLAAIAVGYLIVAIARGSGKDPHDDV